MSQRTAITTSLFDFFKIGPGPSSSHTIGPMRAGYDFYCRCLALPDAVRVRGAHFQVRLFGSLSATGKGHGTATAVLAGLLGHTPEACPPALLQALATEKKHTADLAGATIDVHLDDVVYDAIVYDAPFSNTLTIDLSDTLGCSLFSLEYYSTGGGFIQWKGMEEMQTTQDVRQPAHAYSSMAELLSIVDCTGLALHEVLLENEMALTGVSRPNILHHIDDMLARMEDSVRRGLNAEGILPGSLRVVRKARSIQQHAARLALPEERMLANLNAYAFATAEENASGGVIVTAPTCGASGVVPAMMYALRHQFGVGDRALREGLLAAAAVGFLAKHNASIAGAEVGCQGEVGVASAMAAAFYANAQGNNAQLIASAAEIALEHHLGLTCDPVQGFVQIPCIERNAMGVVKAYNAALLARCITPGLQRVSLDAAIAAMAETGRDMHNKFKETSLGGLAVSVVEC